MDSVPGGSTDEEAYFSRYTLIGYYRECTSRKHHEKLSYLLEKMKSALRVTDLSHEIKCLLTRLVSDYKTKLHQAHENFSRCANKNKDWFNIYVTFPVVHSAYNRGGGRPSKKFEETSDRSKRRKTERIRKLSEPAELAFAAQMKYRECGNLQASKIIKETALGDTSFSNVSGKHETLSSDKALSLLIEGRLTKFQYNTLRSSAMESKCNLYPNYEAVIEAKKRCYPQDIICTETSAEVPLQNLLDHTAQRLCLSLSEVLSSISKEHLQNLSLVSKWGCDGSGSHSEYKQKFENPDDSDANMVITSVVPVQLVHHLNDKTVIVWQNPRPSSPRYCRPLRLEMAHETAELSRSISQHVQNQIDTLTPTKISREEECFVKHRLIMTMVDGKMVNALTETSSAMRCYICKTTSKDFNRIKFCISKPIAEETLTYGISPLHAWIRFAECILHVSYKAKVARWQVRDTRRKALVAAEKHRIQTEFWEKLGLHVDKPRQGGGTSTDGNTARAMFQHAEEVAEITGISLNLLNRLHTILKVMSSGYKINAAKFKTFCLKTACTFVIHYPWFNMPTTFHKILIHGSRIIETSEVAIGLLSEDAQESRNKDVRKYREQFSRRFSRKQGMEDTYQRLMVSSDPFISGLRKLVPKKSLPLCQSVLNLLEDPELDTV